MWAMGREHGWGGLGGQGVPGGGYRGALGVGTRGKRVPGDEYQGVPGGAFWWGLEGGYQGPGGAWGWAPMKCGRGMEGMIALC